MMPIKAECGRIRSEVNFWVYCMGCGTDYVDGGIRRRNFENDLRIDGWRIRSGKWNCPACVEKLKEGK